MREQNAKLSTGWDCVSYLEDALCDAAYDAAGCKHAVALANQAKAIRQGLDQYQRMVLASLVPVPAEAGAHYSLEYAPSTYFSAGYQQVGEWLRSIGKRDTLADAYVMAKAIKRNPAGKEYQSLKDFTRTLNDTQVSIKKISDWTAVAESLVPKMVEAVPTLEKGTVEQLEFLKLFYFDHTYDYSDCGSTWRAGQEAHQNAKAAIDAALLANPALDSLVGLACAYYGYRRSFFTTK